MSNNITSNRLEDVENFVDELNPRDGLPRHRLVLLTGSPGLGKTTLAHLLAEHAGYQVVEMNARYFLKLKIVNF